MVSRCPLQEAGALPLVQRRQELPWASSVLVLQPSACSSVQEAGPAAIPHKPDLDRLWREAKIL
jgi:hypothetical protein